MGEKPNAADEESAGAGAEQRAGHLEKMHPVLGAAPESGSTQERMKFGPALADAPVAGGGGAEGPPAA